MSDASKGLLFNISHMQLVQTPGFVAPRARVPYTDPAVQDLLATAFEGQLPPLAITPHGHAVYCWMQSGRETCALSRTLNHPSEIPASEAMRLLQGWMRLHQLLAERNAPEGIRSMLLNLKLPHPERAIMLYRVWFANEEEPQLRILHGFENQDIRLLPFEEAIALILNVPPQQIAELARQPHLSSSTSLPKSIARKRDRKVIAWALPLLALLATGSWFAWEHMRGTASQTSRPSAQATVAPAPTETAPPPPSPPSPAPASTGSQLPKPSVEAMSMERPKAISTTPKLDGMIQ